MLDSEINIQLQSVFREQGFKYRAPGGTYIFTNGKANSFQMFLKKLNSPYCFEAYPILSKIMYDAALNRLNPNLLEEAIRDYSMKMSPVSVAKVELTSEEDDGRELAEWIKTLVPTVNVSSTVNKVILLDPSKNNRPVLDVDYEVYLDIVEKTYKSLLMDDSVLKVMTVFDPYTLKSVFVRESKNRSIKTWHVNYYSAPQWRFVKASPVYGGFIKDLVEHLFPIESEREYVLDWMHYAIVSRNETVLCLIGARGTGKGILLKDILSQLIGVDYREIVNQEILTEKFNAAFKNKRYVFFDEVNVSGDRELNRFKAFANSHIALEAKGEDSETIDNYTSMGLSSNDKKDFRAEPQERRFSVPEVTETPFLKVKSEKEIEDFCKRIEDPESIEIAEFGHWLLERKPKNSSRTPLKGRYYFELCRLSMPEWKTFLIDFLITYGVVDRPILINTISRLFRKTMGDTAVFPSKRGTIETFLLDYLHEGVYRMGVVKDARDTQRGRDTYAIIPNEEFIVKFGKIYNDNSSLDAL